MASLLPRRGPRAARAGLLLAGALALGCAPTSEPPMDPPRTPTPPDTAATARSTAPDTAAPDTAAAPLHIALQEGFEADLVVVRVDGDEVYRADDVGTDVRIGLAHAFDAPARARPVRVEVALPERGITGAVTVEQAGPVYIGASVVDGALTFQLSAQPFGYV